MKLLRNKLKMTDEMESVRAPLASQEAMEESPLQICGQISEFTRGKEFKVIFIFPFSLLLPIFIAYVR